MTNSDCPSRATVAGYLRGKLEPDEAEAVAQHLLVCPPCASTARHFMNYARSQQSATGAAPVAPKRPISRDSIIAVVLVLAFVAGLGTLVYVRNQPADEKAPPATPSYEMTIVEPTPDASSSTTADPSASPAPTVAAPDAPPADATPSATATPAPPATPSP